MFDEHIEEAIRVFRENDLEPNPQDIALSVVDTAVAQKLIENNDTAIDLAYHQIQARTRDLLAVEA